MSVNNRKSLLVGALVSAIFLIMAIEMFYLTRQNQRLKVQIQKLSGRQAETIPIGSIAPDFSLKTISGETISLDDFNGMNLILIFFSTECPGCVMDIPNWNKLTALESDTVHVLGISQADANDTKSFMDSYALNFEVVIDPTGKVKEMYKCGSVPQKILINRKRKIEYIKTGAVPHNETGDLQKRFVGS